MTQLELFSRNGVQEQVTQLAHLYSTNQISFQTYRALIQRLAEQIKHEALSSF